MLPTIACPGPVIRASGLKQMLSPVSVGACHVARQLLEGATAGELQGMHVSLQRVLQEAPGRAPAAALPALEASLLALETAEGRAIASQVTPASWWWPEQEQTAASVASQAPNAVLTGKRDDFRVQQVQRDHKTLYEDVP